RRGTIGARERGVLVAELVDDRGDLRVVDRLDLGPEVEVAVVAQPDLRPDRNGGLEDDRLARFGLDDLDLGPRQGDLLALADRLAIGVGDEVLDRLVHDRLGTEDALEHGAWRLARPEACHPRAPPP